MNIVKVNINRDLMQLEEGTRVVLIRGRLSNARTSYSVQRIHALKEQT